MALHLIFCLEISFWFVHAIIGFLHIPSRFPPEFPRNSIIFLHVSWLLVAVVWCVSPGPMAPHSSGAPEACFSSPVSALGAAISVHRTGSLETWSKYIYNLQPESWLRIQELEARGTSNSYTVHSVHSCTMLKLYKTISQYGYTIQLVTIIMGILWL